MSADPPPSGKEFMDGGDLVDMLTNADEHRPPPERTPEMGRAVYRGWSPRFAYQAFEEMGSGGTF